MKAALVPLSLSCFVALGGCRHEASRPLTIQSVQLADPGVLTASPAMAAEVYVPVYSRLVYSEGIHLELSALLTVRNTDVHNPIVLESVRYFDSHGNNLRNELQTPGQLGPMASAGFLIKKSDDAGGEGAAYVVRWRSEALVSEPLVEVLMAEISGSQSLAFVSRGHVTRTARGAALVP